jgi:hypothetical protein
VNRDAKSYPIRRGGAHRDGDVIDRLRTAVTVQLGHVSSAIDWCDDARVRSG